ncbi:hypothetical protein HanHA300_Chr04g0129271 [Helianthus annuus]|nr:hypothetical protein HanHA300_Chr04g0129271 [Helianthus annuus]KAJ0596399.1 hypothetical protein HanHA89_Chr04g0142321 [Helianthus annuus]KAJ0757058.1 hypothetical protein HanLR1_Chr04g0134231 [Helianthus annuus]KAJ0760793.1 hypothetical protein HanOQP8_Chr04g0142101 [Helianthus annuus]
MDAFGNFNQHVNMPNDFGNMPNDQEMEEASMDPPSYPQSTIEVREKWCILQSLRDVMTPPIETTIRQTCFGPYLDNRCTICDSLLLIGVAQLQISTPFPHLGISYRLRGGLFTFIPKQFCLITGLRFGHTSWSPIEHPNLFKNIFFRPGSTVSFGKIMSLFENVGQLNEDDTTRICLLMLIGQGFLGWQKTNVVDNMLLDLVDNLEEFRQYPWGNYFWESTYSVVYNLHNRQKGDDKGFSLSGFVWPFKM